MKKLSFFSIPRNKTRKETIEVIKNALITNGWKFVEKSERRKNKPWVRAGIVQKMSSISIQLSKHFLIILEKHRVLDQKPIHRSLIGKGGQLFALVCFRETHEQNLSLHHQNYYRNNCSNNYKSKQHLLSLINFFIPKY